MDYREITPAYPDLLRMEGRHVVVLGAGQGMGRQTAHAAAAVGARVSCIDLDGDRVKAVADEIDGAAIVADVTSRTGMEALFTEATDRLGVVHGVADIVGIAEWAPLVEIDDGNWSRSLEMNLRHQFLAMQIAPRFMTAGGSMAFVASISGQRSAPNHAVYGAAKAGLMNLIGTAAIELAPSIRVNGVAPGMVLSPRAAARATEESVAASGEWAPLGRIGHPYDIASALLFFLSDLSQWVTGQTLTVDGGTGRKYQYEI